MGESARNPAAPLHVDKNCAGARNLSDGAHQAALKIELILADQSHPPPGPPRPRPERAAGGRRPGRAAAHRPGRRHRGHRRCRGPVPHAGRGLKAAGLTDTLKGPGPFTVFAPTDAAFAKLPKATLAALLKPENKAKLTAILTYHVLKGEVKAAQVLKLKNGTRGPTVEGATVTIHNRGGVRVNNARVIKTDIAADNGVIHVIDTVLMPPSRHHG